MTVQLFPPCNYCGAVNHQPADLDAPVKRVERWVDDELIVTLTQLPPRHDAIYRCFDCALSQARQGMFGPDGADQLEAARDRIMALRDDPTSRSYRDPEIYPPPVDDEVVDT